MGVDRALQLTYTVDKYKVFGPRVSVDNLEAAQVGVEYFGQLDPPLQNPVVVSPDAGGVYRAKSSVKRCINVLEQNLEWL